MKRLISLDIFRGLAIIGVIFTHCIIFNSDAPGSGEPSLLGTVIKYFLTWAGMFGIISGIGNTIAMYGRVRQGTWTPKKALTNSLLGGMITILVNYLYLGIFAPGYLPPTLPTDSLLSGLIRRGLVLIPSAEQLLFATALMMIGWGIIFSGISVYIITKRSKEKVSNLTYIVLGIVATVCVLIYPLLQTMLRPLMAPPLTWENIGGALIASWIVGPMDPMFPYAGFALFGVIFGLMFVDKVGRRKILTYGYGVGAIFSVMGFLYIAFNGFSVTDYDTPPLGPLISILGPMMLFMTLALHVMDLSSDKAKRRWVKYTKGTRTFSLISLSAFLLEGPIAALVRQILNLILPGFTYDSGLLIIVFMPIVMILWGILVRQWAKVQFKGSIEWFINRLVGKLTGKKTNRLDGDYLIKSDSAYLGDSDVLSIKKETEDIPSSKTRTEKS